MGRDLLSEGGAGLHAAVKQMSANKRVRSKAGGGRLLLRTPPRPAPALPVPMPAPAGFCPSAEVWSSSATTFLAGRRLAPPLLSRPVVALATAASAPSRPAVGGKRAAAAAAMKRRRRAAAEPGCLQAWAAESQTLARRWRVRRIPSAVP